jgi:hypothetical protein
VSVVLHEQKPATQLEELRSCRIDLSISRTPVNDVALTSTPLCSDLMLAALLRGHALGRRKRLSLPDCAMNAS